MTNLIKLKRSNCKNCYKCIRQCPVKSIRFSGNQAHIIEDECIYCGQCFVVCPQDAKVIADGIEQAKVLLAQNEPVVASIAPSFTANYDGIGIEAVEDALKQLGFFAVEETALGATLVKNQYQDILNKEKGQLVITSCCPTVNLLIQKYYPGALQYLAPVVTPMHAHCLKIKEQMPEAKTVFIGPCISKKYEALETNDAVDCVLTFEELSKWLEEEGITLKPTPTKKQGKARLFPTSGGIIKSMNLPVDNYGYNVLTVDGIQDCISALEEIEKGGLKNCFIEMSACKGSCIGGPVMAKYHHTPLLDYTKIIDYAGAEDFSIAPLLEDEIAHRYNYQPVSQQIPGEDAIQRVLKQMGKTKPEDQLNCSSCGYNSCRDKAIAVLQGKADISMCLPFLSEKAASFSDNIIRNTPNGILVLNENFEVQQINEAASRILSLNKAEHALGESITNLMDASPLFTLQQSGKNVYEERMYLAEYKRYVDLTVIREEEYQIYICIMSDITGEMEQKKAKEALSHQTVETADKVIEKQMRIVQEIASLLGETTAETKIALTKLKESITDE